MLLEHWFVHSKVCRRKVNPLLWAHPRETLLFHFEDEKAEDQTGSPSPEILQAGP